MGEHQQAPVSRDAPDQRRRIALLLRLSPAMFFLCYLLAAMQGAKWQHLRLIAAVGTLMCLGVAGICKLRGSKSADDLVWLNILLRLFTR